MICVHINIVNIYVCVFICVYRYIFNNLDKPVSVFSLVGDQGTCIADIHKVVLCGKILGLHCG